MPLNKSAYLRYHIIDACLRDNRKYTREQILDKIYEKTGHRISKPMFEKDLYAMRNMQEPFNYAPIKYNRADNYYFYEDATFSLTRISLKDEELEAMEMAAGILNQYIHLPLMKRFSEAVQGIRHSIKSRRYLDGTEGSDHIKLQKTALAKGAEYVEVLSEAIVARKVVQLKYKTFESDNEHTFHIHPYLLNEHQNRWYIVGLCEEYEEIRTFGLDRILHLKIDSEKKYERNGFDTKEHYRYALGIVAPAKGKPEIIKLKLSRKLAKYLLTQPIHESQKLLKETKDFAIFEFMLYITYELESKILSWGSEVEVIAPAKLKKSILAVHERCIENDQSR